MTGVLRREETQRREEKRREEKGREEKTYIGRRHRHTEKMAT